LNDAGQVSPCLHVGSLRICVDHRMTHNAARSQAHLNGSNSVMHQQTPDAVMHTPHYHATAHHHFTSLCGDGRMPVTRIPNADDPFGARHHTVFLNTWHAFPLHPPSNTLGSFGGIGGTHGRRVAILPAGSRVRAWV
jgi:hypothetical protein